MGSLAFSVFNVDSQEGEKYYVTCLPHEQVLAHGMPSEAIVGSLLRALQPGEAINPAIFARNRVFVDFMHGVIARRASELPGMIAEARRQQNGIVCIIDRRTRTPQGPVPPEDIVGVFEVRNGQVVPNSYRPSPKHSILSPDGFFQLANELEACLLEELSKLV